MTEKTDRVPLRVSEEWLREVEAAAELADLDRSEFIRRAGMEKASATSPRELEAKKKSLEAEAKTHEQKAEKAKRKAKQLQQKLEQFGDEREQYEEAIRELANGILDGEDSPKLLEDASAPRIRKIANIPDVAPQQVVRDLKNELAVESADELPRTAATDEQTDEDLPFANKGVGTDD